MVNTALIFRFVGRTVDALVVRTISICRATVDTIVSNALSTMDSYGRSTLSVRELLHALSERRCTDVPGLLGGGKGSRGRNLLVKLDPSGRGTHAISLGGKATVEVAAGDCLRIESPGGGGYGVMEGGEVEARLVATRDAATVEWMFERHREACHGDAGDVELKTGSVREFDRKQAEA